jgi:quinoprotein glucose dehydrogenase
LVGQPENAHRLAAFAALSEAPDHLRVVAVKLLADWAKPPRRDPITGLRLALADRPASDARQAVDTRFPKLFNGSEALRAAAIQLAAKLDMQHVAPQLADLVVDPQQSAEIRAESLYALEAVKATQLKEALTTALAATEPKLRAAAVVVAARSDPTTAGTMLPAILSRADASLAEKQAAFAALGSLPESKDADEALAAWLDQYSARTMPTELRLDLMDAVKARLATKRLRLHAPLRQKIDVIDAAARVAERADPLARNRDVLHGGDAEKGRAIFLNNAAVYCQRCHRLEGQGGEVGPPLDGIGKQHPREYLLEAILFPSQAIAKGYESVILETADGRTLSGVLRSQDANTYVIVQADGKVLTVPKQDVDAVRPDKSAMPEDLHQKLTKRELRNLIEFLASLTSDAKSRP